MMVTLISTGGALGDRRCDAKCYDADGGRCACICGGANHGVGRTQASDQTAVMAETLMRRHGGDVTIPGEQLNLLNDGRSDV